MHYLIGLGNPGADYRHTPHNVGRDLAVRLSEEYQGASGYSIGGLLDAYRCSDRLTIVSPRTFMNHSGQAAAALFAREPGLLADNLAVIYDDIDLPWGELKISFGKGAGGHRGVESIEQTLNTREFLRLRIGVAPVDENGEMRKPRGREAVSKYLLSPYSLTAHDRLVTLVPRLAKVVEDWVSHGTEYAVSVHNSSDKK